MIDYKKLVEESIEESVDWRDTLVVGKDRLPIISIDNYIKYFENDDKYKGKMWYNEFTNKKELNGRPLTDEDYSTMYLDIEKMFGKLNRAHVDDAVSTVFSRHRYDPVKDYVKSLKWDGVKRIDKLFIDCLGAENNRLNRYMTRKWMIAGVKRVFEPGCPFDNILILTGAQGIGKTTMCERLSRGYYNKFSFDEISSQNKDTKMLLGSTWIAVFEELDGLGKRDQNSVKSFLSTKEDTFRKPYGREDVTLKRRCVFIGSTNESRMLSDDTGNRRFWVIECDNKKGKVWETMTPEYVDQLWAEAYVAYKNDPTQFLDIPDELWDEFNKKQDEHNSIYNDAAFSYLDVMLDRTYTINSDGEVYDYKELLCEDENGYYINKIPIHVVSDILIDHKYPFKNIKNVVAALKDWEYKVCKYKKMGRKSVMSLVRRNPIEQKDRKYDIMSAFGYLDKIGVEGLKR